MDLAELEAEIAEFRRLSAEQPDNLYPGLAFALSDISALYRDDGRMDHAIAAASEAVSLFETLTRHDDSFRMPLAVALTNLSARQQDNGQPALAAETSRRAVAEATSLPPEEEDTAPILAAARMNLATQLFLTGAEGKGAAVLADVGGALRALFEAGDIEQAGHQAAILNQFARRARDHEKWAENAALRRALVLAMPDGRRFAAPRAQALTMLAIAEDEFARPTQAAEAWAEAVEAWRALPQSERQLATALSGHARALEVLGRPEPAVYALDEAAALWKGRDDLDPATDGALLADVLYRLGTLLLAGGRAEDALYRAEEGLGLVLSSVVQAGVASPETLGELQALRVDCLRALGREA
jgi:tetratricopeptide (TPR) repeat protein